MTDIVERLRETCFDKDNFPRTKSERWLPIGLAQEAAAEIERLRAALRAIIKENDEFRAGMPEGWEGDPLQDACEEARRVLSASPPADQVVGPLGPINDAFHCALKQFPDERSFNALHFFWNEMYRRGKI